MGINGKYLVVYERYAVNVIDGLVICDVIVSLVPVLGISIALCSLHECVYIMYLCLSYMYCVLYTFYITPLAPIYLVKPYYDQREANAFPRARWK